MLQENNKIKVRMIEWPRCREIKTRNHGQVFTVTKHPETGKPCIDWRHSLDYESTFVPLTSFSWTVVFENIDNGKLYHNNAVTGGVIELSPEFDNLRRACAAGIS